MKGRGLYEETEEEKNGMTQEIIRDPLFLSRKSQPAEKSDIPTGLKLAKTLNENRERCVGLAANMIGIRKRIIVVTTGKDVCLVMFNPVILEKSNVYETEEGCLSLDGVRKAKRYRKITVEYTDMSWKKQKRTFTDFEAQIIQHEMDHLEGILI